MLAGRLFPSSSLQLSSSAVAARALATSTVTVRSRRQSCRSAAPSLSRAAAGWRLRPSASFQPASALELGATTRRLRSAASTAEHGPPTAWPDLRLWLHERSGAESGGGGASSSSTSARGGLVRSRDRNSAWALDVYQAKRPGTREVKLGDLRFFAFTGPRLGAEHFVVWRRLDEVRKAVDVWKRNADMLPPSGRPPSAWELPLEAEALVTRAASHEQLTAPVFMGVGTDADVSRRDPRRYWDRGDDGGPWLYWDSFWAPSDSAALATDEPAFGDASGCMLQRTLGAGTTSDSFRPQESDSVASSSRSAQPLRPDTTSPVSSTATASAFKDRAYAIVYEYNVWGSELSRSGTGSDPWSPEARLAVTALETVVDRFGIRSMLDCACGDATWMVPFFVAKHPEIEYCGADVVREVIEENRRRHPTLRFLSVDLADPAGPPLPRGAELVFSKESLNHMGLEDALRAVTHFADTGAKYLLTNVHEGAINEMGLQKNCFTTYVRYDYSLPPFNLKRIASVIEYQGPNTSYQLFAL